MDLITTTSELAAVCARLARHPVITVDTEFLRETTYYPLLCVVQMASADEAVVIDTLAEGIDLKPFFALMADEKVLKVFHAARQDIEIVWHRAGIVPHPIFDTQVAAMVSGFGAHEDLDTSSRRAGEESARGGVERLQTLDPGLAPESFLQRSEVCFMLVQRAYQDLDAGGRRAHQDRDREQGERAQADPDRVQAVGRRHHPAPGFIPVLGPGRRADLQPLTQRGEQPVLGASRPERGTLRKAELGPPRAALALDRGWAAGSRVCRLAACWGRVGPRRPCARDSGPLPVRRVDAVRDAHVPHDGPALAGLDGACRRQAGVPALVQRRPRTRGHRA